MWIRQHKTAAVWLVLYLAAVAAVLGYRYVHSQEDESVHPGQARINKVYPFERLPVPPCTELDSDKLSLHINGMDTGLRAAGCNDGKNLLSTAPFDFKHVRTTSLSDSEDKAVWSVILGRPLETLQEPRTLRYEIRRPDGKGGFENIAPADAQITIRIFEWWWPAAVAIVLLVWASTLYLGSSSALLRDSADPSAPLEQRTYSLAKTQMAWWFAIVFACFVFLWMVTGETPSISGQALSLLGIASATTAASLTVSANQPAGNADGRAGVFFWDLLSDAEGITIHRFQMVVMTVTLGLVFLIHVARYLVMPELDASLLTLMGISSATYVGMKIPEAKPGDLQTTAADAKSGYSPTP